MGAVNLHSEKNRNRNNKD